MPYKTIEAARAAGFPVTIDKIDLTLSQINELAKIYDAIKEQGGAKEPMAIAISQFKKNHKKKGDTWITKDSLNIEIDKKRIGETEDTVIFPIRFVKAGVLNKGLITEKEIDGLVPYFNGLPIIQGHPGHPTDQWESVVVSDRRESKGFTANAKKTKVHGTIVIEGDAHIYKRNRDLIKKIEDGKIKSVSGGYSGVNRNVMGESNGEKYSKIREHMMPFHVAYLEREDPACAPPICGINLDCNKDIELAKIYIPNNDVDKDNLEKINEVDSMDKPEEPKIIKTKEQTICLTDLSLDSLIENPHVKSLVDYRNSQEEEMKKVKAETDSLKNEIEELKKYKDQVEKLEADKLNKLRDQVKESKFLKDEEIAEMNKCELERILKVIDAQTKEPQMRAVPGGGSDRGGNTVGFPDAKGEWK